MSSPPPPPPGPEAAYLAALRQGRFLYQRRADGRAVFPPRLAGPGDGAALDWAQSAGRGQVHAVTEQPRKPPAASRIIALIDMDEGFRLLSRIETDAPVSIGMAVRAVIAGDADPPHVYFIPAGGRDAG